MAEPIDLFQPLTVGIPVARMQSCDGRLGKLARGHLNITTLISQGWVILPDPVNRLLPEYRSACLTDLNVNDAADMDPLFPMPQQPKEHHYTKGKRPRIRR